ncbi:hypothetical protein JCM19046_1582 [Bacillus sp. JCM 19046]|nr:hypothetical protein JCM19046_1582 [Bacillus sp. JCM 19046]
MAVLMKNALRFIQPKSKRKGVSLADIKRGEKTLGALFPDEYKALFLMTNGGVVGDWTLLPLVSGEKTPAPDLFAYQREKRPEGIPNDLIVIGTSQNGEFLCYRVRKRFMQELVFIWNEKTGKTDCSALTLEQFFDWYAAKRKTKERLGTFPVTGTKLLVSDAIDGMKEDGNMVFSNVKAGDWTASLAYMENQTVKHVTVFYGKKLSSGKWHDFNKPIVVDSASVGIFNYDAYQKVDDAVHERMFNTDEQAWLMPEGVVALSGYGDGIYTIQLKYNVAKQLVGLKIDFDETEGECWE